MVNGRQGLVMRIRLGLGLLAALTVTVSGASAFAAGSSDCGRGPPAGWNAPRVTYTYSGSSYDRSYTRSASHEFAAQRHSTVRYSSPSYRPRHERW